MLTQNEMLYAYMDGLLGEEEEVILFSHLAANDALRDELRAAMAMRQSVQAMAAKRVPSPELGASVFAALGVSMLADATRPTPTSATHAEQQLTPLGVGIVSALLSAVITATLLYNVVTPQNSVPSEQQTISSSSPKETTKATYISRESASDKPSPYAANQEHIIPKRAESSFYSSSPMYSAVSGSTSIATAQKPQPTVEMTSKQRTTAILTKDEENWGVLAQGTPIPQIEVCEQRNAVMQPQGKQNMLVPVSLLEPLREQGSLIFVNKEYDSPARNLVIQMRSISTLFKNNKQVIIPEAEDRLNNIAIAALYKMGDSWYAGIEAGKETFPIFIEQQGDMFTKVNSLTWGGVFVEKEFVVIPNFPVLTLGLKPLLGTTLLGPVGKATTALRWKPDERVLLSVGVETSGFFFNDKNTWHIAPKVALNYGVSVFF